MCGSAEEVRKYVAVNMMDILASPRREIKNYELCVNLCELQMCELQMFLQLCQLIPYR